MTLDPFKPTPPARLDSGARPMDGDDVLRVEDVAEVRAAVIKTRRKVLLLATITPVVSAVLVGWLVNLKLHDVGASALVGSSILVVGVPLFVHLWRHYRSILAQLDVVARRIASGETVLGSKVAFHSYR